MKRVEITCPACDRSQDFGPRVEAASRQDGAQAVAVSQLWCRCCDTEFGAVFRLAETRLALHPASRPVGALLEAEPEAPGLELPDDLEGELDRQ